jgi:hypothetical protein
MDNQYVECLVATKTGSTGYVFRILGALLVLVSFLTFALLGAYCLIVVFFAGYLEYKIFSWTNKEYEYVFVDGELRIDRILGQSSRKNFLTLDFSQVEVAAYEEAPQVRPFMNPDVAVTDVSSQTGERCMFLCGTFDGVRKRIIVEPDEKMAEAFKRFAPQKVFLDC